MLYFCVLYLCWLFIHCELKKKMKKGNYKKKEFFLQFLNCILFIYSFLIIFSFGMIIPMMNFRIESRFFFHLFPSIGMQLNADGYGLHTSPTHHTVRTPLVPRDLGEDFSIDFDDEPALDPRKPKNAKYVMLHFVRSRNLNTYFYIHMLYF